MPMTLTWVLIFDSDPPMWMIVCEVVSDSTKPCGHIRAGAVASSQPKTTSVGQNRVVGALELRVKVRSRRREPALPILVSSSKRM